jgi:hypothetical protein
MEDRRFLRLSLLATAGLLIWAAQFTALYMFNTLACTRGFAELRVAGATAPVAFAVAATAAGVVLALFVMAAAAGRRRAETSGDAFLRHLAVAGGALAIVAMVWNAAPAFIAPACH